VALKRKTTLSSLKKKAWKLVSEYIRRSHADEGGTVRCYTCPALMFWKESQAGHAIGGRGGAVLFDLSIIRPQCYACNAKHIGNGRPHIFARKLAMENGQEWWDKKVDGSGRVVKWSRPDLEDFIAAMKTRIALLNDARKAA
jgi:hypothetical protein